MNIKRAEEHLRKEYERALGNAQVDDPVAYALYKTWRKADSERRQNDKSHGQRAGKTG